MGTEIENYAKSPSLEVNISVKVRITPFSFIVPFIQMFQNIS